MGNAGSAPTAAGSAAAEPADGAGEGARPERLRNGYSVRMVDQMLSWTKPGGRAPKDAAFQLADALVRTEAIARSDQVSLLPGFAPRLRTGMGDKSPVDPEASRRLRQCLLRQIEPLSAEASTSERECRARFLVAAARLIKLGLLETPSSSSSWLDLLQEALEEADESQTVVLAAMIIDGSLSSCSPAAGAAERIEAEVGGGGTAAVAAAAAGGAGAGAGQAPSSASAGDAEEALRFYRHASGYPFEQSAVLVLARIRAAELIASGVVADPTEARETVGCVAAVSHDPEAGRVVLWWSCAPVASRVLPSAAALGFAFSKFAASNFVTQYGGWARPALDDWANWIREAASSRTLEAAALLNAVSQMPSCYVGMGAKPVADDEEQFLVVLFRGTQRGLDYFVLGSGSTPEAALDVLARYAEGVLHKRGWADRTQAMAQIRLNADYYQSLAHAVDASSSERVISSDYVLTTDLDQLLEWGPADAADAPARVVIRADARRSEEAMRRVCRRLVSFGACNVGPEADLAVDMQDFTQLFEFALVDRANSSRAVKAARPAQEEENTDA